MVCSLPSPTSDVAYKDAFLKGCAECDIPTRVLSASQVHALEPYINPELKLAVQVPDATLDCWRLPMRFFATAKHNGADIGPYTEVIEFLRNGDTITGVRVKSHTDDKVYDIGADMVVNATGALG